MKERWKPIAGFDVYKVSSLGNVRSPRGQLKPQLVKGYKFIQLPGRFNVYVGKLVLVTFKGPAPAPEFEVDHKNRIKTDDRLSNLRWLTHQENNLNKNPRLNSSSGGVKGVSWYFSRNKWVAQAGGKGWHKNIGYYDTIEEAAAARAAFDRSRQ